MNLAQMIAVQTCYINNNKVVRLELSNDVETFIVTHQLVNGELRHNALDVPVDNKWGQALVFACGLAREQIAQYLKTNDPADLRAIAKKIRE